MGRKGQQSRTGTVSFAQLSCTHTYRILAREAVGAQRELGAPDEVVQAQRAGEMLLDCAVALCQVELVDHRSCRHGRITNNHAIAVGAGAAIQPGPERAALPRAQGCRRYGAALHARDPSDRLAVCLHVALREMRRGGWR